MELDLRTNIIASGIVALLPPAPLTKNIGIIILSQRLRERRVGV